MKSFLETAKKAGVKFNKKGYAASTQLIKGQIKGLIAQKLWDMNEFYSVVNQYDGEVQKALKVLQDDAMFEKLKIDH